MKKLYMTFAALALAMPMFAENPELLYVRGEFNDWDADPAYSIKPIATNPNVYKGTLQNIPYGQLEFKIADETWSEWNIGVPNTASTNEFEIFNNYTTTCYLQNGGNPYNLYCNNWETGTLELTFNIETMVLQLKSSTQPAGTDQPAGIPEITTPAPDPQDPEFGDVLYIVGAINDWDINYTDYTLTYDNLAKSYQGTIYVPAGKFMFRFYTQLGNWDFGSIGAQVEDSPVEIPKDQYYLDFAVWGKGSWSYPDWVGGEVVITFFEEDMMLTFNLLPNQGGPEPIEKPECLYVRGTMNNWNADEDWAIYPAADNEYLYEGTFYVDETDQFQFKIADENWGNFNFGAENYMEPIYTINEETPSYTITAIENGNNIFVENWAGGNIYFGLLLNEALEGVSITFAIPETTSVNTIALQGMNYANGVVSAASATNFTVYNLAGKAVAKVYGQSVDLNNLPAGVYMVKADGLKTLKVMK